MATMTATPYEQQAWDLLAMVRPPYTGRAPLHFTAEWYTADELAEAWKRYIEEHGNFGSHVYSHMWHGVGYLFWEHPTGVGEHELVELSTDLRCTTEGHNRYGEPRCLDVGRAVTRIQCDHCRFLFVGDREQGVMRWHDHHFPGWRDLPVIPAVAPHDPAKQQKFDQRWALENYPAEWQRPGAPIITTREGYGTRSVPGRSPWGGMDIASESLVFDVDDPREWEYDFRREYIERREKEAAARELLARAGKDRQ